MKTVYIPWNVIYIGPSIHTLDAPDLVAQVVACSYAVQYCLMYNIDYTIVSVPPTAQ